MSNSILKFTINRDIYIESIKNNIFLFYLIFYILGPAFINIFITLLSIYSLYLIFKYKQINFDLCKSILVAFILYIPIKDFLIGNFNLDILSLLRFVLIILTIEHYRFFNFSHKSLLLIIIILLMDGAFQYLSGTNILGFPMIDNYRITSLFRDEPIYGGFLLKIFFPILFICLSYNKKNYLFLIFFLILMIFLSGERNPLLQLFIGIILSSFLFFKYYKKYFLTLLVTSTLIFYALYNFNAKFFDRYFYQTFDAFQNISLDTPKPYSSLDIYLNNYYSGILTWKNKLLLGNGYRNYKENCYDMLSKQDKGYLCSNHPHNLFIETLTDHGILGFLILITYLITLLLKSFSSLKNQKEKFGFLITFILVNIPFLPSGSIYSSFYGSLYFLFIIMLHSSIRHTNDIINN